MKRDRIDRIAANLHNNAFLEKYGIKKTVKGDLFLLNYEMCAKPNSLNKLCRGTVFRRDGTLLMLPFERFFNEHEAHCANVDWRSARIIEKIDGTMVSTWYDDVERRWRLSTKKMVDELLVEPFGGGNKVDLAKIYREFFPDYEITLNKKYWYVFELVSQYNRIVTSYQPMQHGLYMLAVRQRQTLDELMAGRVQTLTEEIGNPRVRIPAYYHLYGVDNREKIQKMFENKPVDWEGVVVVDHQHNRMKIKQSSYVRLHHVASSSISSRRNMLDLVLNGEQSEILAYFPELAASFLQLEMDLNMLKKDIMNTFGLYNHLETQKEFALAVKELPYAPFLFRLRRGEDLKYQFFMMGGKKLEKYLYDT